MSSRTFKKELTNMMESNGFELQRHGTHLVWKHVSGVQIFTSATPSCRHALNQIKRQIRQKGVKIN
jgi:predicted RNA binding protein YcfA (HicA-like mRNA interferase family)